jgi:hypothetical protein
MHPALLVAFHRQPINCVCLLSLAAVGELSVMLGELHKIHTTKGVEMMIQDLTPGNILVDDSPADGSMRLLLADPAMAQPIKQLQGWPIP